MAIYSLDKKFIILNKSDLERAEKNNGNIIAYGKLENRNIENELDITKLKFGVLFEGDQMVNSLEGKLYAVRREGKEVISIYQIFPFSEYSKEIERDSLKWRTMLAMAISYDIYNIYQIFLNR